MEQNIFKIKKAFLIPFILIIALLFLLLLQSLFDGQPWEKIFLAFSFTATLLVGIEAAKREIVVTRESLIIKKFFRSKNFSWPEITQLAVVELRNKVYFLLTTTKGFFFFSNLYENHPLLIRSIVDRLASEKVEIEVRNYLDRPVERRSQIIICWITVIMIAAFIILKLLA
ncbi:MAG: hypothetical protein QMD11_07890 [Smithella sp.]|nr:hypothetical protein [Smithella sp.]